MLFKAGDKPDGMYLVRKGELRVFLDQNGKEVTLVTVADGGMIGEMALFDHQPRSASVKAVRDTEVTLISTIDFDKLMKQIPKWFVGLMSALSGRLRQTNERLQKLEAGGGASNTRPYHTAIRLISILELLWHKFAAKEGAKDLILQKDLIDKNLIDLFGEDKEKVRVFFDILVKEQVLSQKQDSYKKISYNLMNRSFFSTFLAFLSEWNKNNPTLKCLPDEAVDMLRLAQPIAESSAYDSAQLTLEELMEEARKNAIDSTKWKDAIQAFKAAGDAVKLIKTGGGSGFGIRMTKKELPAFAKNHRLLAALHKGNLS